MTAPAAQQPSTLRGGPPDARRSVILETTTRLVFHTVLVFSVFLLVAGHSTPGGGFIAGLVAGLAYVLRYVAGGEDELRAAAPVDPSLPLGTGLAVATGYGLTGWVVGAPLSSEVLKFTVPVFGEIKFVTSLVFDVGVYLIVVGLSLGVLRTFGAGRAGTPEGPDAPGEGAEHVDATDTGEVGR